MLVDFQMKKMGFRVTTSKTKLKMVILMLWKDLKLFKEKSRMTGTD